MIEPNSSSLFHFTKSVEILYNIILTGFKVSYSKEIFLTELIDKKYENIKSPYFIRIRGDIDSFTPTMLDIPMVCFCDIPLESSETHRNNFGKYGIGLSQEWAYSKGLNLINYLSRNSDLAKDFENLELKNLNKKPDEYFESYLMYLQQNEELPIFLPNYSEDYIHDNYGNIYDYKYLYFKPYGVIQRGHGSEVKENYRIENEWRFIPKNAYIIRDKSHLKIGGQNDFRQNYLQYLEKYKPTYKNLDFLPEDIENLVVQTNQEKAFLSTKLLNTHFEGLINKIIVIN